MYVYCPEVQYMQLPATGAGNAVVARRLVEIR